MSFEWLNYLVAVDGVTITDAHADRAQACSERELVINSIEQPHGEGRLTPSTIFDRVCEYSDRFDDGDVVSRDDLLDFAIDVGRYYELSPGITAPRFIQPIDLNDPCIDIKASEIQRQIDEMIDHHHRSSGEVHWDQGTELLFAIGAIFATVIVGVVMGMWFKFRS